MNTSGKNLWMMVVLSCLGLLLGVVTAWAQAPEEQSQAKALPNASQQRMLKQPRYNTRGPNHPLNPPKGELAHQWISMRFEQKKAQSYPYPVEGLSDCAFSFYQYTQYATSRLGWCLRHYDSCAQPA